MELGIFEPHDSREIDELRAVTHSEIADAKEGVLRAFSVHALWVLALVVFAALCSSECVQEFFVRLDGLH